MTTYAEGSQSAIKYRKETTWGTTPSTAADFKVRFVSESLQGSIGNIQSSAIRSDRMMPLPVQGAKDVKGGINIEFAPDEWNDFLESVMFNAWDVATKTHTGTGVSFDSTTHRVISTAASFTAFDAGDLIKVSNATLDANNTYFIVSAVATSGYTLTVDHNWQDVTTSLAGKSTTVRCTQLVIGSTKKGISIEKWFSDITAGFMHTGCLCDSFDLSITPNAIVTGAFSIVGKGFSAITADDFSTATDKSTTAAFAGSEADMQIQENGSALALVSSLSLRIANNLSDRYVLQSDEKENIPAGRNNVTGTLQQLYANNTLINKAIAGTATDLDIVLASPTKSNGCVRFFIPNVRLEFQEANIGGEGDVMHDIPFSGHYDSTTTEQIIIQR